MNVKTYTFKINYSQEPSHKLAGESKFELIIQNDDSRITYTTCDEKNQYIEEKTAKNVKNANANLVWCRTLDILMK